MPIHADTVADERWGRDWEAVNNRGPATPMPALLFIRWIGASRSSQLLGIGVMWGVPTLGFEIPFGRFVVGASWERIASDYNVFQGGLMPLGMVVLVLSPWIAGKVRGVV